MGGGLEPTSWMGCEVEASECGTLCWDVAADMLDNVVFIWRKKQQGD